MNSISIPRLLLAVSTIITLVFTDIADYFPIEYYNIAQKGDVFGEATLNFFFLPGYDNIVIAKWIAVGIMVLVAMGVLPAITCFFHTWIAYSFVGSSILVEGGDQMNAILSLFLIPFCLDYGLSNTWVSTEKNRLFLEVPKALGHFSIRLQMSICYAIAAIAKFGVPEWSNGTALYYWFNHNVFGANDTVLPIINSAFSNPIILYFATIFVLISELVLALGIIVKDVKTKKSLFALGTLLHLGIWFFVGLGSFSIAMIGGLYLYYILLVQLPISKILSNALQKAT